MENSAMIPLSPFHRPISLRRLTRSDFDELSRLVIAQAFASQNELGRLCDEAVYQNDIALRLDASPDHQPMKIRTKEWGQRNLFRTH